jgi:hypothetical protein
MLVDTMYCQLGRRERNNSMFLASDQFDAPEVVTGRLLLRRGRGQGQMTPCICVGLANQTHRAPWESGPGGPRLQQKCQVAARSRSHRATATKPATLHHQHSKNRTKYHCLLDTRPPQDPSLDESHLTRSRWYDNLFKDSRSCR